MQYLNKHMTMTTYTLNISVHSHTGRMVALCPDLPEFIAQGMNARELNSNSTLLIKRILEDRGYVVRDVILNPVPPNVPSEDHIVSLASTVVAIYDCAA